MSQVAGPVARVGAATLAVAADVGGMTVVLAGALRRLVPPRLDTGELMRSLRSFGEGSLPIVVVTAAFAGMIMVLQAAPYVRKMGLHSLTGWYTGFSVLREVAPLLIGLMFSGRVGANNTSELAAMRVREQLDAMRVLGLDVYELFVVPRMLSMILALMALVVFGDLVAVLAGALCARVLLGVDTGLFVRSLVQHVGPADFLIGVEKAFFFGAVVAIVSTHYGLRGPGGGAGGVGRAVNAQVVGSAVGLFWVDYMLTSLGG